MPKSYTVPKTIKIAARAKLGILLAAANGRRRERTLGFGDLKACISAVRDGAAWSYEIGGSVAANYGYPGISTVILAARVDSRIHVGITTAGAISCSVGRAWPCLQPWWSAGPRGDSAAKFASWAKLPDVIRLSPWDVSAVLRDETKHKDIVT